MLQSTVLEILDIETTLGCHHYYQPGHIPALSVYVRQTGGYSYNANHYTLLHTGDDTPTLRDLRSNFVTQYAAHWEKLGLELGLKEYRIVNISKNNAHHPRSAEECCAPVLEQWLKETPSPTWSKLDDAVKNIKLSLSTSHDKEGNHGYFIVVH